MTKILYLLGQVGLQSIAASDGARLRRTCGSLEARCPVAGTVIRERPELIQLSAVLLESSFGEVGLFRAHQNGYVIVAPSLKLGFSSFGTMRLLRRSADCLSFICGYAHVALRYGSAETRSAHCGFPGARRANMHRLPLLSRRRFLRPLWVGSRVQNNPCSAQRRLGLSGD